MKTFREFCMEEKQDNLDEVFGLIKGIGQAIGQTKLARQFKGDWAAVYDDIFDNLSEKDQNLIQRVEKARSPAPIYSKLQARLGDAQSKLRQGMDLESVKIDLIEFLAEIRRKVPGLAEPELAEV